MSKTKWITLLSNLSNERGLSMESLVQCLEEAFSSAVSKELKNKYLIQSHLNINTGELKVFRLWNIISDHIAIVDPNKEIHISEASKKWQNISVDSIFQEPLDYSFSRIASHEGKQIASIVIQRESSKKILDKIHREDKGLLSCLVVEASITKLVVKLLDYNILATLSREQLITNDRYRKGDILKAVLHTWRIGSLGELCLDLTRKSKKMLEVLLTREVPEIEEGSVIIHDIARIPGVRSKVSVESKDNRIDPVGSCIGFEGRRIDKIMKELCGEKVDIVLYHQDIIQYVKNAFTGLRIQNVTIGEKSEIVVSSLPESKKYLIGLGGSNVKLVSSLTHHNVVIL